MRWNAYTAFALYIWRGYHKQWFFGTGKWEAASISSRSHETSADDSVGIADIIISNVILWRHCSIRVQYGENRRRFFPTTFIKWYRLCNMLLFQITFFVKNYFSLLFTFAEIFRHWNSPQLISWHQIEKQGEKMNVIDKNAFLDIYRNAWCSCIFVSLCL